MFLKVIGDMLPHGIKNHLHALRSGYLDCRHKITVARDYDDLIDKTFERERHEIKAEPHIDTFLPHVELQVLPRKLGYRLSPFENSLFSTWLQDVLNMRGAKPPHPKG